MLQCLMDRPCPNDTKNNHRQRDKQTEFKNSEKRTYKQENKIDDIF